MCHVSHITNAKGNSHRPSPPNSPTVHCALYTMQYNLKKHKKKLKIQTIIQKKRKKGTKGTNLQTDRYRDTGQYSDT